MRVVVAIGGSVLVPEVRADRVAAYADALAGLADEGWSVGAVIGGGPVAREYIEPARELGANEIQLDELGIAVTRLNARLLVAALGDRTAATPARTYEAGGESLRRGDIAVMGGVAPGQTTDAVGAAFAEYADADLLVYATSVPGVFDADPNKDTDAERFDRLTAAELVDVVVGMEMNAGASSPVDLLAAKLIERSRMRAIVLEGNDPDRVVRAITTGDHGGTEVVPAGLPERLDAWP